ncbi:hypothetical protein K2173_016930 [Erythroxylum novogranatense]|uniref:Transmembrane protein n=1 Tax=Erythroxylum novogranatense TaxID=1862640 RepID=A0AAV8U8H7_9ROSI|nr:hypothetical protein K2173_016930 [Erythroxylum novogranatense]
MQRSASGTRILEEFLKKPKPDSDVFALELEQEQQLPTYDPLSHAAKKERSRLRSAENAVHFIPFVLLLSAVILWCFSHPESEV